MKRWNELQLRFELQDFDEVEEDAAERLVSPEEARQISEAARLAFEGRGVNEDEGGWWEEYLRLREQGWPWRVAAFIGWAASPKARRWPGSVGELAREVLGLKGPRAIYTWRRKFPSIDATVAMLQAAPLFEHRRDVLNALVEMARQADYKAFNDRKLFLEMVGDYVPKSKLAVGLRAKNDLGELSDAELDALLGEDNGLTTDFENGFNGLGGLLEEED